MAKTSATVADLTTVVMQYYRLHFSLRPEVIAVLEGSDASPSGPFRLEPKVRAHLLESMLMAEQMAQHLSRGGKAIDRLRFLQFAIMWAKVHVI